MNQQFQQFLGQETAAQGPDYITAFSTGLTKELTKRKADRERNTAKRAAVTKEKQKQALENTFAKKFEKIAKLTKTGLAAKKQLDKQAAAAELEKVNDYDRKFDDAKTLAVSRELFEKYDINEKGLFEDYAKVQKFISGKVQVGEIDPESAKWLLRNHGGHNLMVGTVLTRRNANNISAAWKEALADPKQEWNLRIDENPNDHDSIKRDWTQKYFSQYSYDPAHYAKYVKPIRDKWLQTEKTIGNVASSEIRYNNEETAFEKLNDENLAAGDSEKSGIVTQQLLTNRIIDRYNGEGRKVPGDIKLGSKEFLTDTEYAVKHLMTTQGRILRKGDDSKTDLDVFLDGEITHWGNLDSKGNPQKITLRKFLGEDNVKKLYADAEIGRNYNWELKEEDTKIKMQTDLTDIIDNNRDADYINKVYNKYSAMPSANSELLRKLDRMRKSNQSQSDFEQYAFQFEKDFLNGTLDEKMTEIANIPNNQARVLYDQRAKSFKGWKDRNLVTKYDGAADFWGMKSENAVIKGEIISDSDSRIAGLKLKNFYYGRLSHYLRQGLDPETGKVIEFSPNILINLEKDMQKYKDDNGWGVADGTGIFSYKVVDGKRTFPNLKNALVKVNIPAPTYDHTGHTPHAELEPWYNKNIGSKTEDELTTPGAIFSNKQVEETVKAGFPSQDMQYIRWRLGNASNSKSPKDMGTLWNIAVKSLQDDAENTESPTSANSKALLLRTGLDKYDTTGKSAEVKLDEKLQEEIKKAKNTPRAYRIRLMRAKLKNGGWETLHPEDLMLLLSLDERTKKFATLDQQELELENQSN